MRPLVLALNPSVDVEWRVPQVRWEEKNDVLSERRWPGGKGVNVARWLKHLGVGPQLLMPLGGSTGKEVSTGMRREKISIRVIPLREPTRTNVIVTAATEGQLRFNPLGPLVSAAQWKEILRQTKRELAHASVLVLSGSLPRGLAVDAYAKLIRIARDSDVRTLLDCDGPRLAAAIKERPFLVKPNHHELEQWSGRTLMTPLDIQGAASELSRVTRGWVLVSLGEAGALLVNDSEGFCHQGSVGRVKPLNTVGAGDALLAAVANQIQRGASPEQWLKWGVATGTAATTCPAGVLPTVGVIRKIAASLAMS